MKKQKIFNKRGFLLAEETLKMVIALISIGFLIYFLVSLYMNNKNSEELEMAKASLERLISEIDSLGEGEVRSVEIYNPKGWVVISWPFLKEKTLPKSCSDLDWDNCICVCKDVSLLKTIWSFVPFTDSPRKNALDKCDNKGICLKNSKGMVVKGEVGDQSPIFIKPPLFLKIDEKNNKITE